MTQAVAAPIPVPFTGGGKVVTPLSAPEVDLPDGDDGFAAVVERIVLPDVGDDRTSSHDEVPQDGRDEDRVEGGEAEDWLAKLDSEVTLARADHQMDEGENTTSDVRYDEETGHWIDPSRIVGAEGNSSQAAGFGTMAGSEPGVAMVLENRPEQPINATNPERRASWTYPIERVVQSEDGLRGPEQAEMDQPEKSSLGSRRLILSEVTATQPDQQSAEVEVRAPTMSDETRAAVEKEPTMAASLISDGEPKLVSTSSAQHDVERIEPRVEWVGASAKDVALRKQNQSNEKPVERQMTSNLLNSERSLGWNTPANQGGIDRTTPGGTSKAVERDENPSEARPRSAAYISQPASSLREMTLNRPPVRPSSSGQAMTVSIGAPREVLQTPFPMTPKTDRKLVEPPTTHKTPVASQVVVLADDVQSKSRPLEIPFSEETAIKSRLQDEMQNDRAPRPAPDLEGQPDVQVSNKAMQAPTKRPDQPPEPAPSGGLELGLSAEQVSTKDDKFEALPVRRDENKIVISPGTAQPSFVAPAAQSQSVTASSAPDPSHSLREVADQHVVQIESRGPQPGSSPTQGYQVGATTFDTPRAVVRQLTVAVQTNPDTSLEVHLNPTELGRVRIAMTATDSGMMVHVQADRPEILDLLRRNADLLAQDFRDAGYEAAQFSFGSSQNDQGQQSEDTQTTNGSVSLETPEMSVANSMILTSVGPTERVDLRL